jgi:hypothetical protein
MAVALSDSAVKKESSQETINRKQNAEANDKAEKEDLSPSGEEIIRQ